MIMQRLRNTESKVYLQMCYLDLILQGLQLGLACGFSYIGKRVETFLSLWIHVKY